MMKKLFIVFAFLLLIGFIPLINSNGGPQQPTPCDYCGQWATYLCCNGSYVSDFAGVNLPIGIGNNGVIYENYCCGIEDGICPLEFEKSAGGTKINCGGCPDPDCPPCEFISASITPFCGTEGCNVEDYITLNAEYDEVCGPNYLEIQIEGITKPECNFIMSIGCYGQTSCSNDWIIPDVPEDCIGETVYGKKAILYNADNIQIAQTNLVSGGFLFIEDGALTLQNVDLWPEDKTIKIYYQINYYLDAFYKEYPSQQIIRKDVTLNFLTNYTSSDDMIASNSQQPKNVFEGLSEGDVEISGFFPFDLIHGTTGLTKTDSTGLTVIQDPAQGCHINSLLITPDCGIDGKCNEGEIIDITLTLETLCISNYNAKKIVIDARDLEGGLCNFQLINNSISSSNCLLQGGKDVCELKWQIPEGFFQNIEYQQCSGKIANAHFAELFNNNNAWLDSKQGDFGSFEFYAENIPPIAVVTDIDGVPVTGQNIPSICTSAVPVNGFSNYRCWDIYQDVVFEQASYDPDNSQSGQNIGIRFWKWYLKKDNGWINFNTATNEEDANFSFNFYNNNYLSSGTYNIKLNVTDWGNAVGESEIYDIILWDGNSPIAFISEPLEEQEIDSPINITFNGSDSWAPGSENEWWFEWYYENNPIKEGGKIDASVFNYTFIEPKSEYIVNLSVYNQNQPSQKSHDSVLFHIGNCIGSGNQRVFVGECIPGTQAFCDIGGIKNYDCEEEFCCTSGNVCEGTCQPPTANCEIIPNPPDCNDAGSCYWENIGNCLTCFENNLPLSCSDYDNSDACNIDNCGMGYNGLGTENCNNIIEIGGIEYRVDNCHCSWSNSVCNLNYTLTQQGSGSQQNCEYSISYSECGESSQCSLNEREITYTLTAGGSNCQPTYQQCQSCAVLFRPMPFFSWWNVLAVIALLVIVYAFILKRKK